VIQECLRLQPGIQVGYRQSITEFEYKGFTIPKGWRRDLIQIGLKD